MKGAVIYYSLEGNTKEVATLIAQELQFAIVPLVPSKEYPKSGFKKFVWGGKSAMLGDEPKLNSYSFHAQDYDVLIVATPIWASTFAPPLRTFFKENKILGKKLAILTCSGGGSPAKCIEKIKEALPGNEVIATLHLIDPKTKPNEQNNQAIRTFCDTLKAKA